MRFKCCKPLVCFVLSQWIFFSFLRNHHNDEAPGPVEEAAPPQPISPEVVAVVAPPEQAVGAPAPEPPVAEVAEEIPDDMVLADLLPPPLDGNVGRPDRAPAPRVYRSPAEILEQISAPGSILRLSFNDWRFKAESLSAVHGHLESLAKPFSQKSYSKVFGDSMSWQEALKDVHGYAWRKYHMLKDKGCIMAEPETIQRPGVIADSVLDLLKPEIDKMPPPTQYSKKK